MQLTKLADEYLHTINILKEKVETLHVLLSETKSLETKRKIRERIFTHESILRQSIVTHHHLKHFYDKDVKTNAFI